MSNQITLDEITNLYQNKEYEKVIDQVNKILTDHQNVPLEMLQKLALSYYYLQ